MLPSKLPLCGGQPVNSEECGAESSAVCRAGCRGVYHPSPSVIDRGLAGDSVHEIVRAEGLWEDIAYGVMRQESSRGRSRVRKLRDDAQARPGLGP